MGKLLDNLELLYRTEGEKLSNNSSKWMIDKLQSPSDGVSVVNLSDMLAGKFYFLLYNLQGKSSKLEQYAPILLTDWKQLEHTKIVFGLSINFIPMKLRIRLFDKMFDGQENLLKSKDDKTKAGMQEQPMNGISYENVYQMLSAIGFEYSIREFDLRLVNKVYEISFTQLERFLTMNSQVFTNVDEGKLAQIWKAKLKTRDERHQNLMKDTMNNWKDIDKVLEKSMQDFKTTRENLNKSIEDLNNLNNIKNGK